MIRIINSPAKYIQGPDTLNLLAKFVTPFGDKALVIFDGFVHKIYGEVIESHLKVGKLDFCSEVFGGESTRVEIDRLHELCQSKKVNVIIGVGGGKTLDTAKAVAFFHKCPVVIAPTIASTDSPTSSLSVIYTAEGQFQEYLPLPKNPDIVLMDSTIIAKAPARLLVSGMGDALSTYFEARASSKANKIATCGGLATQAALNLSRLCLDTLLENGLKAKFAVQNGHTSLAVENIIEANTYLSGIGFESGGLAAAHAIHNGLTRLKSCDHLYHGEKVAFGTLVQLVLENAPLEEIDQIIEFCQTVGLPTCLADMGAKDATPEQLMDVATASCVESETIHNMPFKVTAESVFSAIMVASELGSFKSMAD